MHVAESYVWRYANGDGYVGRSPRESATKIARPGDLLDEATVESLNLKDLKDRTDYDAAMAAAVEAGAYVTVLKEVKKGKRVRNVVASVPAGEVA